MYQDMWKTFFNPFLYVFCKVSWIRKKDYHLLTVGLTTYSSDERFSALHLEESEVGNVDLFESN